MSKSEVRRTGRWVDARRAVRAARTIPPPQRRYALLMGGLYAALLGAVLNWGSPALPWRVGARPERDIQARAAYLYSDPAAKSALERRAAEATPNFYRRDDSPLLKLADDLARLLKAITEGKDLQTLKPDSFALAPPSPEEFDALKSALPRGTPLEPLLAACRTLITSLADSGLISQKRKDAETRQMRERFKVLAGPGRPPTSYDLKVVMVAEDRKAIEGMLLATSAEFGPGPAGETLRRTIIRYIARRVKPNLRFDAAATEQARHRAVQAIGPVMRRVLPGQVIARRGQPITPEVLAELRREQAAYLASLPPTEPFRRLAANLGLALILVAFTGGLLLHTEQRIVRSKPRLLVYGLLCVLTVGTSRFLAVNGWPIFVAPVALAVIALTIAYNQRLALMTAFVLSMLSAAATTGRLETFLVFLSGSAVGALGAGEVRNRRRLIEVGFAVALAQTVAVWVGWLIGRGPLSATAADSLWALAGGVMTGFVITGGLPFIEMVFNITTDISLLELSAANQPLLRRLALDAPGTYNHSLVVGSLAEAAAEAIGANGLLARLGALFHDVGKIVKPEYFAENRTEPTSRHDTLTPRMSALVIINHVKDGLELARQHHLPKVIRDIIAQHHGTTLVEYFYHQAQRQHEADLAREGGNPSSPSPPPDESRYRYPGPLPRTKEAAIVMLADAVESACRSLSEPTPNRIRTLVHDIVRRRTDDGQFDECALTFKELALIQDVLASSLARIYHSRVRYPGQEELEKQADLQETQQGTPAGSERAK